MKNVCDSSSSLPSDHRTQVFHFVANERRPVEVLVFTMDPQHVAEFLRIDHDVWTLGEAMQGPSTPTTDPEPSEGDRRIPFLSKEVWLDEDMPGTVTMHFVWETREGWARTAQNTALQHMLQSKFDQAFPHPYKVLRIDQHDKTRMYRFSRFAKRSRRKIRGLSVKYLIRMVLCLC